jgi:hypothetical protein
METDVLDDPVALVEDAKDGRPLRHRSHSPFAVGGRRDVPRTCAQHVAFRSALAAGGKRERQQHGCNDCSHRYSGIQGS